MKYLLLAALLLSFTTRADDQPAHDAAHFGMSYAIHTFSYGLFSRAFQMPRPTAQVFAGFVTLFGGAIYKLSEPVSDRAFARAMLYNGLGVGSAVVTINVFEF